MTELNLKLDYYGALNLHKTLLEAKFHAEPENPSVAGSPFAADVFIQVRDYLIENGKGWAQWYQLKNQPTRRARAIERMKQDTYYASLGLEEKKKAAGHYLAPFLYDEAELAAVMDEVEKGL